MGKLCKKLIEMPFVGHTRLGSTHHVLAGCAYWCQLANRLEQWVDSAEMA